MSEFTIPIISLDHAESNGSSENLAGAAKEIAHACEDIGIFAIVDHGIPAGVIEAARNAAQIYFSLPAEQKMTAHIEGKGRGYIPFQKERLGATMGDYGAGDLKESFNIVTDFAGIVWPEKPENFRTDMERLFKAMHGLADELMRIFAAALGLETDFFKRSIENAKAILRATHYPALHERPLAGQERLSAHTDYGTLTVVCPDCHVGGFQAKTMAGTWIDVTCPNDAFVVHIGDLMERWTNGKWKSTPHRVVIPDGSDFGQMDRLSMVFLHNPNPEAVISPLSQFVRDNQPMFEPIIAEEYLRQKSEQSRKAV